MGHPGQALCSGGLGTARLLQAPRQALGLAHGLGGGLADELAGGLAPALIGFVLANSACHLLHTFHELGQAGSLHEHIHLATIKHAGKQ